jgi:hypothetical protein
MAQGTKRYTLGITLKKELSNPSFVNLLDNGTLFNINDTALRVFIENAVRDVVTTTQTQTLTNKTLTDPTINAQAGVIVLPQSATPAQTAEGSISWDSDDDLLTVGNGSVRKVMTDTDSSQTLTNKTLTNPTINASAGSITVPSDPASTTAGTIGYNTATNFATIGNGTVRKTIVDEDSAQTLSNKTLTNPTLNIQTGTLIVPQTTLPIQTTEGSISWDSDDDLLTVGTGSARKTMVDTDSAQSVFNKTIRNPVRLDLKKDTLANLLAYANASSSSDNGQIVFATDTKILYQVVDSNLTSLAVTPASGEANTASNLGTGIGLYKQKQLVDLQFKSLKAGTNVSVVDNGDDITVDTPTITAGTNITVTPGTGITTIATTAEINTASNVGTVANGLFKQKTGVNLEFKSLIAGSNITITPGTDDVTIAGIVPPGFIGTVVTVSSSPTTLTAGQDGNVFLVNTSTIPITLNLPTSPTSGQRFVIKDERGTFGANPVTMTKFASHTIERLNANYLLEANFGTWTFVFDGVSNWVII